MDLKEIFYYNHFANKKVVEALQNGASIPDKDILRLTCHIVGAHHEWLSRMGVIKRELAIWPDLTLEEISRNIEWNMDVTLTVLEELSMDKIIHYKNSKGVSYSNSVEEILFHIANHSNYHRGQVATKMRAAGMQPAVTDYIFYKR